MEEGAKDRSGQGKREEKGRRGEEKER